MNSNESWLTPELVDEIREHLPAHNNRLEPAMLAALPPLVLASEVKAMKDGLHRLGMAHHEILGMIPEAQWGETSRDAVRRVVTERDTLRARVAELGAALDRTETTNRAQHDTLHDLTAENAQLKARVAELERERDHSAESYTELVGVNITLRDQVQELTQRLADTTKRPQPSAPNAGEALTALSDEQVQDLVRAYRSSIGKTVVDGQAIKHMRGVLAKAAAMLPQRSEASETEWRRWLQVCGALNLLTRDSDGAVLNDPDVDDVLEAIFTLQDQTGGRTLRPAPAPAPAPVAADAGLTDEECKTLRRVWYDAVGPTADDDMRAVVAKYLALRPQPARLRMPTVEDYRAYRDSHEREIRDIEQDESHPRRGPIDYDGIGHRVLVAFLRTLGAEIVEGWARTKPLSSNELRTFYTRTIDSDGPDSETVHAMDDWLRREGVGRVEMLLDGMPFVPLTPEQERELATPAPASAPVAVPPMPTKDDLRAPTFTPPPGTKRITFAGVECGDTILVDGVWKEVASRDPFGTLTFYDGSRICPERSSPVLVKIAAPAPAREPELDERSLRNAQMADIAFAMLRLRYGDTVDQAIGIANDILDRAAVRRRVEGEEAGK